MERKFISSNNLYSSPNKLDTDLISSGLRDEKLLTKLDLLEIISKTQEIFKSEPNLLELSDPITILGDIHGQFYDLLQIFSTSGPPQTTRYIFLGDYIDRGGFSLETITLLLCYKLSEPTNMYLLRGNHESRAMSSGYGFRTECLVKYDLEVYDAFMDLFDTLPIAAVVGNMAFLVHGGISEKLKKPSDINLICRFRDPPKKGIFCDMLWSDVNYNEEEEKALENFDRGCGILYSKKMVLEFLENNDLVCVIRAHEQCEEGFKMKYWEDSCFPSIVTLFSAPNYCDHYGNKGGIAKLDDCQLNIKQFRASDHPYMLMNQQNAIDWSAPFIISKILQIFSYICNGEAQEIPMDEYTLQRIKEIDPSFEFQQEVKPYRRQLSINSVAVPEEDSKFQIPTVSVYKPSLVFSRNLH